MALDPHPIKFVVLKSKDDNEDPCRIWWKEVGTLLIRHDMSGGVLYLHWLDGGFTIKPADDDNQPRRKRR